MGNKYSQAGQDRFTLSLVNQSKANFFLDIGCWVPDTLNNTLLLEENGWDGISIDITDLSAEWSSRKSKFICTNALTVDYQKIFDENGAPQHIDYLNLDIEGDGTRFKVLEMIMKTNRDFSVITIEHDMYRGYELSEKLPQVELLTKLGYTLVCDNVCLTGNPFEDWWVNPKYISTNKFEHLICSNKEANEIIKLL